MSVRLIRVLCALCLGCAALAAQQSINNASLAGRVTDPSGAVVPGAQVAARQTATDVTQRAVTDRDGRFRFPYLPVGPYEITASHAGFADVRRALTLTIGAAFELPLSLPLASSGSTVTVNAAATVLENARSEVAATITPAEVQNLPLNGRNFLDLALLAPGVSPTNTASTSTFAETSAVPGQGLSVNSQRNFSNSFIVDGVSANDDASGLTQTFYGLDVVDQFQVVTSGGQAEFGRALGGTVNMVTRSGTDTLHGDAYGFFDNQRLDAANPLTDAKLPLTQAQYGASLGGPIRRGHTFYFANFEQRELNQDGLITIAPASVALINTQLAADNYPGEQIATGYYPNPIHTTNLFGRLDHQSANDQLAVRYNLYDVNSQNSRGAGSLSAASAAAGLDDIDHSLVLSNIDTLSPETVNETRAEITYSSLNAPVNDPIGPAVSISGVAAFGTLSASPTARLDKTVEVVDNLSRQWGAHALRAGADFLDNDTTITYPQSIRGSYAFASLAAFQQGLYTNSGFTQSFGNPVVPQNSPNIGVYAQDAWTATPSFTLNAGVRYDLEFLKTIATQTGNVSPRLGFAWAPFHARRTLVRGGFGVFYDRIPLRPLANALLSSGNTTDITPATFVTVSLSPGQTGAPVFPDILSSVPAGVLVNFTTMDRNIRTPYSEQGSLEVEEQLGARASLDASYQHVRGVDLIIDVNQNTPTCAAAGDNNGCRADPLYGNNKQYSSLANSQYDGLEVSFLERAASWGTARASYTYSKALDDVSEFFFSGPINNFNVWQDWGRSDDDQRQRLALDATASAPRRGAARGWRRLTRNFQLGGTLQAYSALPFNIVTGANTVQGTTARPVYPDGAFIGRNTGDGFGVFNVSARLSRTFALGERAHVEAIAEAFNALNHPNYEIPNATFGSGAYPASPLPTFGQATAVAAPRAVQLALRISF